MRRCGVPPAMRLQLYWEQQLLGSAAVTEAGQGCVGLTANMNTPTEQHYTTACCCDTSQTSYQPPATHTRSATSRQQQASRGTDPLPTCSAKCFAWALRQLYSAAGGSDWCCCFSRSAVVSNSLKCWICVLCAGEPLGRVLGCWSKRKREERRW